MWYCWCLCGRVRYMRQDDCLCDCGELMYSQQVPEGYIWITDNVVA